VTTNFLWASQSSINLANGNLGSASNGSAVAATTADLDVRTAGNAALMTDFDFLLISQFATVTGIAANTVIADLFLLPKLDGTNLPQIDTTGGSSYIPPEFRVGSFRAAKVPVANTDTYYSITGVVLKPNLYTAYILNRAGQTQSANATLRAYAAYMTGV
jgi:hypothetical protein